MCKGRDQAASHLKVSALLIDWDDQFVDVRDELVTLGFPQSICTLFQKLHQDVLREQGKKKFLMLE